MRIDSSQRGLSSIGWLVVITVVAFFGLCFAKMVPVYMENYYIVTGLKALAEEEGDNLADMTKTQITRQLQNYYTINNVRSAGAKELDFQPVGDGMIITNKYETRVPLIANVDVVMSFHNVLDSRKADECCSAPEDSQDP